MRKLLECLSLGLLLALAGTQVSAAELAGVHLDDHVSAGNTELVLNGAGLRTRLLFKVYVAGLYLPHKSSDPRDIVGGSGPRRVVLKMLRDVDGETLLGALKDGLRDNHTDAELAALQPAITQFAQVFRSVGNTRSGDTVVLDFNAEGVKAGINGIPRGQVADAAFGPALLKVWLGEKPAQDSLKKALLGN
jgi:hypothetical protein